MMFLTAARDFDADHIRIRVEPEPRRRQFVLQEQPKLLVGRRDDQRRRFALRDFGRECRSRDRRDAADVNAGFSDIRR